MEEKKLFFKCHAFRKINLKKKLEEKIKRDGILIINEEFVKFKGLEADSKEIIIKLDSIKKVMSARDEDQRLTSLRIETVEKCRIKRYFSYPRF